MHLGKTMSKENKIGGITVHQFVWDFIDSNAYILIDNDNALIVDPINSNEFWQFINEKRIEEATVILTHEHFDHISGLNRLREKLDCHVYASKCCSRNIGYCKKNLSNTANILSYFNKEIEKSHVHIDAFTCKKADVEIKDKIEIIWNGHILEFVLTPGHSEGSICVILDMYMLFSGDSFMEIPVITRFPGGNKKCYQSDTIPFLRSLFGKISVVFPGHGDMFSMKNFENRGVGNDECFFISGTGLPGNRYGKRDL